MRSQEKEVEWNVLDGCFAGLGLLMLGRLGPGRAVPQLLRGVVVFDCANSNYRKHAKGSVSALVSLGVTLPIAIQGSASSFTARASWSRGAASPETPGAPRARPGRAGGPGART